MLRVQPISEEIGLNMVNGMEIGIEIEKPQRVFFKCNVERETYNNHS